MSGNRTFNNTNKMSKHINQYATDVANNSKINNVSNLNKTYYNLIEDVFSINEHNTIYINDNLNVSKMNKLVNFNDNNFSQRA